MEAAFPLTAFPRLRILQIGAGRIGKLAGMNIGQRRVLEDIAHSCPKRHPHLAQVRRRAGIVDILGTHVSHRRQRAVESANNVGNADRLRRSLEPVAAFSSALADHESGLTQLAEYSFEELRRNALAAGNLIALGEMRRITTPRLGEFHEGAGAVIDPG